MASPPALLLGNGPSLKTIDLSRDTEGYDTFGMNAAYRYWGEIGWWPTYYSCLDEVVGESHFEAIRELVLNRNIHGIRRFLLRANIGERLAAEHKVIDCYEDLVNRECLPTLRDITTGSHTMLWANYLGYKTILVAGVDLNYLERVDQSESLGRVLRITSSGDNPNYFFDGYQQTGDLYNVPNPRPNLHLDSWRNASNHMKFPTAVINVNPDSLLKTFVKNFADHPLVPGLFESQMRLDLGKEVMQLNKFTHATAAVLDYVKSSISDFSKRDPWCAALTRSKSRHDEGDQTSALFFNVDSQKFVLTRSIQTDDFAVRHQLVVATEDDRLMSQIIHDLRMIGTPPLHQRAGNQILRMAQEFVSRFVPQRIRQISLYENWLDFVSYYRSLSGIVVCLLLGLIATMIASPEFSALKFLATWLILLMLFPIANRYK